MNFSESPAIDRINGIIFPNIDPIAFSIFSFEIRWYALSYVMGILLGWWYLGILNKQKPKPLSAKAYDDFIVWAIAGIILGGRLGYILFYNIDYYLDNPSEIFSMQKGGMSFHGGLLGVLLSMYLMCHYHKLKYLRVMDIVACITPIGLFLGRIANFINAELYGRITDVSWGVVFPGQLFARHPSQLYEAVLEGFVLFFIMMFFVFKTRAREYTGLLSGIFLIFYAIFRSIVELFREPDAHIGFLYYNNITMGQLLSIPMILLGLILVISAVKKKKCNGKS